jgi:hypothetical protein
MAANGKLAKSELTSIPGGELRRDAAAAWNAPGGPADAGLVPTGSRSSYRTFAEQEYFWRLYREGQGSLAAEPGTSNHGLGIAIDLKEPWMRDWIDEHGAEYGWRKTEAMSEWWHVNYVGGVDFPTFETLRKGARGLRVVRLTKRLAFIRRKSGRAFIKRWYWRYKLPVVDAVRDFQRAYKLKVDGQIGPKTAAKINGVFKRQWRERGRRS